MHIRKIELTRFGPHQSTRLDGIGDGLTVLYGPNEIGKSSLLAAVRGVLFGRTGGAEPDVSGTSGASGRLVVETEDGLLTIERPLGAKRPPKLILANGNTVSGDPSLREQVRALARVDESIYRSVFTFQLAELNDLSDQDSLAGQMYTAGLIGKTSPMVIEQQLYEQGRDLFIPDRRAKKPPLNECLTQITELKAKVAEAGDKPDDYLRAQSKAKELEAQAGKLREDHDHLAQTLADLQKDLEVLPVHRQIVADRSALQEFAGLPELDAATSQALDSAKQAISRIRESLSELNREQDECNAKTEELAGLFRQLSPGWSEGTLETLHVDESLRQQAADLHERWSDLVRQRERASEALDRAQTAAGRLRIAIAKPEESLENLASELADRLLDTERRLDAGAVDEDCIRRMEGLANEARQLNAQAAVTQSQRQGTPAQTLRMVIAAALLLAAGYSVWHGGYVAAVVMVIAAGVMFFPGGEKAGRKQTAQTDSGYDTALRSDQLEEEAQQLSAQLETVQLPGRPFDLTAAQWLKVYEQLRHSARNLQLDRDRLKAQGQAVEAAREAETQVAERTQTLAFLSRQQTELADDFASLCQEIGLDLPLRTPAALGAELAHVAHWQTAHRQLKRAESHLVERKNSIRGELATLERTIAGLAGPFDAMAETAAAQHGSEARTGFDLEAETTLLEQRLRGLGNVFVAGQAELAMQHEQARALKETVEQTVSRAIGMCGSAEAYEARAVRLDQETQEGLEAKIDDLREELRSIRAELDASQQAYGAITAQLRAWSGEDSARFSWDLAQAKARRAELADRWAVLTIAQALVREARTRFEKERQPAVLAGAGSLLHAWTAGRYTALQARSDTSGKPHIVCLDASGEAWDPMRLSRGTREQVYLCLRLAMIQDYREKGIDLPVILDDPMVNFDSARLGRALSFLSEHAGTSQWIYLTCQPHVAHSAQAMGARVLTMSGSDEKTLAPLEG